MSQSLKQQATRGVMWSAIERFSVQGVQFVMMMLIARLVLPSEYGIIAMLGIFMAIAQTFIDSGFSNALIQKIDRTEVDFSTVFYFNLIIAIVVYLILYFTAPYIASFYNEPQINIVAKWIGLNLVVSGFTIVQRAKLTIKLDFKTQAIASLVGVTIGGLVGITIAYMGYGVWALVSQTLCSTTITSLLLWVLTNWRPSLIFSIDSFRKLFSFGSKLLASSLLHTIYINLYSLVIGKQYSSTDVGIYNQANNLGKFPATNLTSIITRAIYPLQCEIQNDNDRLSVSFHQSLGISCFIIFPLMTSLAALSRPLISIILTDKWLPTVEPLSILCLAYMWNPVMNINSSILNVTGRTDYFLKSEIVKKVIAILILIITMRYGLDILCLGILLYNMSDVLIIIFYSKKVISTGYIIQFKHIASIFVASIITGVGIYIFSSYVSNNTWIQLLGGLSLAPLFYATLCKALKIDELGVVLSVIANLRHKMH